MSYDRLAECLRLIEHGPPAVTPERLSRRVRYVPLAVDVVGDVAAAMFVRRSVSGTAEVEDHALQRVSGQWQMLGGSGGSAPDNALSDRPPAAELGGLVQGHGQASTALGGRVGRNRFRPPFRYLMYGDYRLASEVATVVVVRSRLLARRRARGARPLWSPGRGWVAEGNTGRGANISSAVGRLVGGRPIAVPRHGNVVVAWTSRWPPWLVPLDGDGRPLAVRSAAPAWPPGHRPPMRYRVVMRHPWPRPFLRRRRRATPGWAPLPPPAQGPDDGGNQGGSRP